MDYNFAPVQPEGRGEKAGILRGFVLSSHLLMNVRAFWFPASLSEAQRGISYDCYECSSHIFGVTFISLGCLNPDIDDELTVYNM